MEPTYVIRTAGKTDLELIEVLFGSKTARYFGDKQDGPLSQLFHDYRTHRMVVYEASDNLLAYCEFCIYPNIPVLSNDLWIQWLKCRFCVNLPITLMNTIFLNFFIYESEHDKILKKVLMEAFYREHKVGYLIVTRGPKYSPKEYELLEKFGTVYYPIDFDMYEKKNLPTIIIITRPDFMPTISFRKALPEDNDDVIEMIDYEEPQMRAEHGDYFIAELLLGTAGSLDKDKIIVTEESSSAMAGSTGMMWLSEEIDIEQLIKNFDLESLGNLVTCSPDATHGTNHFEVYVAEQRHYCNVDMELVDFTKRGTVVLSSESGEEPTLLEQLYAKYKYINDQLKSGGTYLSKITRKLTVTFDVPAKRGSVKARRASVNSASKAFILKNFILHPRLRVEHSFYYLCAMFSAYPEHDYCVVPMAPGTKYSASLLALLKFFIRVPHRPKSEISAEIFVAHRSSISTELSVYPLQREDLDEVINFQQAKNKRSSTDVPHENETALRLLNIIKAVSSDVLHNQRSEFTFWIIRCGNLGRENSTVVGFVILRQFSDYNTVYKQFMLPYDEDYLTFDRGEILLLRLHPYFQMWSDEVLRTVALRSGFRELFYFQQFQGFIFPNDLAWKMMPVEPRRLQRNWFIDTESEACFRRSSGIIHLPTINCVKDKYYLFRHNLCQTKFMGNQNALVIIGFSDICKAFLRLMVFGWNTPDFKNVNTMNCLPWVDITVIVKHGEVEAEYDTYFTCDYCQNPEECYLNRGNTCPFVMDATHRLDLRNWIHFVPGKVDYINRHDKVIHLDNHCKIYYDKLLLLCDTRYGLPAEEQARVPRGRVSDAPFNYAHINGRLDKIILYNKIQELNETQLEGKKKIILYGYTLGIHECLQFLLSHGCKSEDITCVQPHVIERPEFLNNPSHDKSIDTILMQMIEDLDIEVMEANFENFTLYETSYFIEKVNFRRFAKDEIISLECHLFINFMENYLTGLTERVFLKSRIRVQDRKILVDDKYCTNDKNIYAAGKHVTFLWDVFHQYIHTNEREMAEKLINILQLSPEPFSTDFRFKKPYLYHAMLPMEYSIIKITMPKRYLMGKLPNEYCHTMTTYQNNMFCRIRMNLKFIVEEITCVTRGYNKPLYFLEHFCGKHDTLLNNLRNRWKLGLIDNFISFFEQPWTEYMMHDRFDEMQLKNHETLISLVNQMKSGQKAMNADSDIQLVCKHFLEANLMKFLRAHRKEFVNKFALPEDWEGPDLC